MEAKATLSQAHYDHFVRLAQAAELKLAQIRLAKSQEQLAELQQAQLKAYMAQSENELKELVENRDTYYTEIAAEYELPATLAGLSSIRWDEETCAIEVS